MLYQIDNGSFGPEPRYFDNGPQVNSARLRDFDRKLAGYGSFSSVAHYIEASPERYLEREKSSYIELLMDVVVFGGRIHVEVDQTGQPKKRADGRWNACYQRPGEVLFPDYRKQWVSYEIQQGIGRTFKQTVDEVRYRKISTGPQSQGELFQLLQSLEIDNNYLLDAPTLASLFVLDYARLNALGARRRIA